MDADQELRHAAERFPMGMRVLYYPIQGDEKYVAATIRSTPWRLGHGAIVIKITGRSGGVSISHLKPIAM